MSAPLTPSKRPHEESLAETNGKGKLQKSGNQASELSPGNVAFRVLCPASKVDNVTGEGGSVISHIFQETLVKVRIEEAVPGCDERVIVVGSDGENDVGSEHRKEDGVEEANVDEKHDGTKEPRERDETRESVPIEDSKSDLEVSKSDNVSPSLLRALKLVFERMVEGETESDGADEESNVSLTFVCRLLVLSSQVGCLLGKGGSVIKQMSSESGAQIRILPRDKLPSCAAVCDELVQLGKLLNMFAGASVDEEVVQINGEFEAVKDALLQITTRLRHHFFRDAFPSIHYHQNPAFLDQPPFQSYLRRDFSPPGMHSNLGPSLHKFDAVGGLPPHGSFHPHDDRAPFVHNIHRLGARPHLSERRPWGPQGLHECGGPLGLPNFPGAPQRRIPGFGGSQPAIVTNTTVEVVVPSSLVPIINGEDGECLKQIRQISDAKVSITEPKPGALETVIIISGTPEQTHAAQSLIQAFVMSETESDRIFLI